jgi:hypothetical protein
LRLRHLRPGGLLCFLFFEGVIALAVLLSLAELVSWLAVPLLPAVVAAMVKINDLAAGMSLAAKRSTAGAPPVARGSATVPPVRPAVGRASTGGVAGPGQPSSGQVAGWAGVRTAAMHATPAPTIEQTGRELSPYRTRRRGGSPNQRRFERPA